MLDSHLWRAAKKNNPAPRQKHVALEAPSGRTKHSAEKIEKQQGTRIR